MKFTDNHLVVEIQSILAPLSNVSFLVQGWRVAAVLCMFDGKQKLSLFAILLF